MPKGPLWVAKERTWGPTGLIRGPLQATQGALSGGKGAIQVAHGPIWAAKEVPSDSQGGPPSEKIIQNCPAHLCRTLSCRILCEILLHKSYRILAEILQDIE